MPGLARSVARGRRAIGLPASVYRERGSSFTPPASGKVLLENNTDAILLEDGTGTLQLEG